MSDVFRVWCEWDIGLADVVFATSDAAWLAAERALRAVGIDDDIDDLDGNGLIGVEALPVR